MSQALARDERLELLLLAGVFAGYAAAFCLVNSQWVLGARIFPLFDDAMISMRFAKNLAAGHGLRMNAGQAPVEGFSDPVWTLLMAAIIKAVGSGLPPLLWVRLLSLAMQGTAVGLFWGLLRDAFPEERSARFGACLLAGIALPGLYWAEMGMETGLQTVVLVGALWAAWKAVKDGRAGWILPAIAFLAPACRLENALIVGIVVVVGASRMPQQRQQMLWRNGLALGLGLALQAAARWSYYGDLLPNTYYLKVSGWPLHLRLMRGGLTLGRTLLSGWFLLAALGVAGCIRAGNERAWLMATPIAVCGVLHVWVGGDAWVSFMSRFLVPMLFMLYFAAALGVLALVDAFAAKRRWLGLGLGGALSLASLGVVESDAPYYWRTALLQRQASYVPENCYLAVLGVMIGRLSPDHATWALTTLGNMAYFNEQPVYDLLGKCDPVIARRPARSLAGDLGAAGIVPGHSKLDYGHSLGDLQPDFVQASLPRSDEAWPYLQKDYVHVTVKEQSFRFYARKDRVKGLRLAPDAFSVTTVEPGQ